MKKLFFPPLFFALLSLSVSAQSIPLKKGNFYPQNSTDQAVRSVADMADLNNHLYVVVSLNHKVLSFALDNGIRLTGEFGKHGQGPGEFNRPTRISVCENEFLIKDEAGYTYLNANGDFLGKLALPSYDFGSICAYAYYLVLMVNFQMNEKHLIDVYSKDGRKISQIGEKFITYDTSKYEGFSPVRIGNSIYSGSLLIEEEFVYYLNFKLGYILKYRVDGTKIAESNFNELFGLHGKKVYEFNKKTFLDAGVKLSHANRRIPDYGIIEDAYIQSGILYLLESEFIPGSSQRKETIRIIALKVSTLELLVEYELAKAANQRATCFSVIQLQDEPVFYVCLDGENLQIVEYRAQEGQ